MIRLFTSFYLEKNEARRDELIECLQRNASNELIDEIIVIYEHEPLKSADANCNIPLYSPNKVSYKLQVGRPTFKQFFDKANELIEGEDEISIIANSDIFFDGSLQLAIDNLKRNECYALSRWERNEDGTEGEFVQRFGDSQDCAIFRGKIEPLKYADFTQGLYGSDNRIAYEIKQAGYDITNPALDVKSWHVHHSEIRNYGIERNEINTVKPPYHVMQPQHLKVDTRQTQLRLLYVGMNTIQRPVNGLTKAFQKHFEVKEINTSHQRLNESIVGVAKMWNPNIVFIQVQKESIVSFDALDELQKLGCFVINYSGDVREPLPNWYIETGKHINLTVFSNYTDVYTMRQFGLNASFCELGIDPEIYTPIGEQKECREIVFFGSHYGLNYFPLSVERVQLVMYMKKRFGERFGVYGTGWGSGVNDIADGNFMLSQSDEAARYRGSSMAINYSHFNYDSYSSDRLTRILGTGTFCLCKKFINCESRFQDGVHLKYFDTLDEAAHWIDYFSLPENKEEKDRIAKNGCDLVHEKYKFEDLVLSVKSFYDEHLQVKKLSKRRVLGYIPIFYGREYLKECIQSMHNHVEKIYVMYTPQPSQGHSTDRPCPESEEELRAIAEAASDKVIWHSGVYSHEAQHRAEIYKFSGGFHQIFTLDSDEVVSEEDIERALEEAWQTGKRNIGISGFINFWKSFDYACYDSFRPIRIINLHVQDNSMAEVNCRIYHFSYAQSRKITDFKWSVSGHSNEVREGWLNDVYYAWTPQNHLTNLHPVANGLWEATLFDKSLLPKSLKSHVNFYKKTIE